MRCPQNESENTVWKRLRHGHRQAYWLMHTYTCVCLHKCAPYFLPYCWVTWNSWFWDEARARDRRGGRGRGSQGQAQFQELVIHIGKRISICLKPFALFVFVVSVSLSLVLSVCVSCSLLARNSTCSAALQPRVVIVVGGCYRYAVQPSRQKRKTRSLQSQSVKIDWALKSDTSFPMKMRFILQPNTYCATSTSASELQLDMNSESVWVHRWRRGWRVGSVTVSEHKQ